MEKPKRRVWKRLAIAGAITVLLAMFGIAFLLSNQAMEAEFADNVLRPLLGDQRVISLESLVFRVQDRFNQLSKKQLSVADYRPGPSATPTVAISSPSITSQPTSTPVPTPQPLKVVLTDAKALSGEGQWSPIAGTDLFSTFIRTDPDRPYSVVNLVYIPMDRLSMGLMAGTKFPGGPAGAGKVPADIQTSGHLVAAFNGGFQGADGHYGMVTDGVTHVPLRLNMPTVRVFADGHADLVTYDGKPLPSDVVAARQNGPLVVTDSKVAALTGQGGIDLWAGTATGGFVTWRSGLGITSKGDVLYAVGDSLTPASLASGLQLAGSQNAIQLDINTFWVRFMIYQWNGSAYSWSRLIPALADGGSAYLQGYEKDFFYLYSK